MALEGPQLRFVRVEDGRDPLERALELMRQVEDLLEEAPTASRDASRDGGRDATREGLGAFGAGAHSTRIARAMAAGLVDELEALVRGARKTIGSG